jgi:hypothetical protein
MFVHLTGALSVLELGGGDHAEAQDLVASFTGLRALSCARGAPPLECLRKLDLSHNSLLELPAALGGAAPNLISLRASFNSLRSLAPLSRCTHLGELWVDNNALADLRGAVEDLRTCTALRMLTLHNNPCTDAARTAMEDAAGEEQSAASRRRAARVSEMSASLAGHCEREGAKEPPGPMEVYLIAALPTLQLLVASPPAAGQASARSVHKAIKRGQAASPSFLNARAAIVHVPEELLKAAHAWASDTAGGGGAAWLSLVEEAAGIAPFLAPPAPTSRVRKAKAGPAKGAAVAAAGETAPGEGTPAEPSSSAPPVADAAAAPSVPPQAAKPKVPLRVVPKGEVRTWSVKPSTTPVGALPAPTPAMPVEAPAPTNPGRKPDLSSAKPTVPGHTVKPLLPKQKWRAKEAAEAPAAETPPVVGAAEGVPQPAAAPRKPDIAGAKPRVPSRKAPLLPRQKGAVVKPAGDLTDAPAVTEAPPASETVVPT